MSNIREYTVVSSQMSTPSTMVIKLRDKQQRRPLAYEPGQYAAISFMQHRRPTPARCFSMTSSPTEQGILEFGIKVQGHYTKTAMRSLSPGSKVIVEGPFGSFIFNSERDRSTVMLAGGIGVTPFMGMLRYAARLGLTNDLMLLYSCRTQDDIPFLKELIELKRTNPHFNIVFVIGSGPTDLLKGLSVTTGRIDGELLDKITSRYYIQRTYFVCGPPGFMKGMEVTLRTHGVAADNIITENFTQGQRGMKALRHSLTLQVYALTGLGLILGPAALMFKDIANAAPKPSTNDSSANQTTASSTNSRQSAVNQNIISLQPNIAANPSNSTTSSGGTTPQTTSSSTSATSPASPTSPAKSPTTSTPTTSSPSSPTPTKTTAPTTPTTPTPTPTTPTTPAPTPPPAIAPSLTLNASSTSITQGDSLTISWSNNSNATSPVTCTASGGWSGSKATSGSQSVTPSSTTTYTLSCSNSAGSSTKSVKVTVNPACVSTASNPC